MPDATLFSVAVEYEGHRKPRFDAAARRAAKRHRGTMTGQSWADDGSYRSMTFTFLALRNRDAFKKAMLRLGSKL